MTNETAQHAHAPKPDCDAIMRRALQAIVSYDTIRNPVTDWYKGYISGLGEARKIAKQALRECGK